MGIEKKRRRRKANGFPLSIFLPENYFNGDTIPEFITWGTGLAYQYAGRTGSVLVYNLRAPINGGNARFGGQSGFNR